MKEQPGSLAVGSQRFLAAQHIRKPAEFARVRQAAVRRDGGFFIIQLLPVAADERPPLRRLGVIATRRLGNAVKRNRCKRLLRELFRRHQDALPANCDVVLMARSRLTEMTFAEIEPRYLRHVQWIADFLATSGAQRSYKEDADAQSDA